MTKQHEYLKELARLALIVAADDMPMEELIKLIQQAAVMYDPEMDELSEFTKGVINLTLKHKEA